MLEPLAAYHAVCYLVIINPSADNCIICLLNQRAAKRPGEAGGVIVATSYDQQIVDRRIVEGHGGTAGLNEAKQMFHRMGPTVIDYSLYADLIHFEFTVDSRFVL